MKPYHLWIFIFLMAERARSVKEISQEEILSFSVSCSQ